MGIYEDPLEQATHTLRSVTTAHVQVQEWLTHEGQRKRAVVTLLGTGMRTTGSAQTFKDAQIQAIYRMVDALMQRKAACVAYLFALAEHRPDIELEAKRLVGLFGRVRDTSHVFDVTEDIQHFTGMYPRECPTEHLVERLREELGQMPSNDLER